MLELTGATELSLAHERTDGTGPEVLFQDCTPFQPGTYSAGAGVYVLTIAPAAQSEGRAKVSGLGNEDAACNIAFSVEGVQFHLLQIALPPSVFGAADRLRNRVAHLLLGTDDPRRLELVPQPARAAGRASTGCSTTCARPAASTTTRCRSHCCRGRPRRGSASSTAGRSGGGSSRRPPTRAARRSPATAAAPRPRRPSSSSRAQVADALAAGTALASVTAADRFAFLPPCRDRPDRGRQARRAASTPTTFLGSQGSDELATTDAALLRALVEESFGHDPIEVGGGERIQRYVVWENEQAVENGTVARRALVFARRTLPYRGIARFGRARFGRSRFAPSVI